MTYLGDFYPSGDEYELVYAATGRLIPPAGIPLQVGCVVNNVETLYNVHLAVAAAQPVTRKFVSVCGAVKKPKSFWAPVGTSVPRPDRPRRRRHRPRDSASSSAAS